MLMKVNLRECYPGGLNVLLCYSCHESETSEPNFDGIFFFFCIVGYKMEPHGLKHVGGTKGCSWWNRLYFKQ